MGWIEDAVDSGCRDMARGEQKEGFAGLPDVVLGVAKVTAAYAVNPVGMAYHAAKRVHEAREAKAEFHRELTREVLARMERDRG